MKMLILIVCLGVAGLFFSCAANRGSLEIMYVQGDRELAKFTKDLRSRGKKYVVEKRSEDIYEVRYKGDF